jgi:hydrogenase nickel incorporation protein HypA/HybF
MAGVEPALVCSAFELLRAESNLGDTTLLIEEVQLQARCKSCATEFMPCQFRFSCPHCGGADTLVVQGDALILESIEFEPLAESEVI